MSRNLCETTCRYCDSEIEILENPRVITKHDAGVYFNEYAGMLVADAECPICLAQYLAWIDDTNCDTQHHRGKADYGKCFDLSFKHSFDDEPSTKDLPQYEIQVVKLRVAKINHPFHGVIK